MKSGSDVDVRVNIGSLSLPEGGGGGTESVSLASEAAAQSNASSLAQMKREIAELEAQARHSRHCPSFEHHQRRCRPVVMAAVMFFPPRRAESACLIAPQNLFPPRGTRHPSVAQETNRKNFRHHRQIVIPQHPISPRALQVLKGGSRATVKLVGWDITELPPTAQFSLCAAGVLICYLSVGVLQVVNPSAPATHTSRDCDAGPVDGSHTSPPSSAT